MFYLGSVLCLHFFKPRLNNTVSTFVGIGCIEFKNYTHTHTQSQTDVDYNYAEKQEVTMFWGG